MAHRCLFVSLSQKGVLVIMVLIICPCDCAFNFVGRISSITLLLIKTFFEEKIGKLYV